MSDNFVTKEIGRELLELISKNASIVEMSQWADLIYSNYCRDLDPLSDEIIAKISFMQHGSEFTLTKENLKDMADYFIEKMSK